MPGNFALLRRGLAALLLPCALALSLAGCAAPAAAPTAAARLAAAQGVTHYLLVSSSGANHASRNGYLRTKGELEVAIKALPFARISVFQPSLLVGERSEFRLGESLARYLLPALTRLPGLQRYRPIRGAQVAARMVEVSKRQQQAHAVYRLEEVFPRPPE